MTAYHQDSARRSNAPGGGGNARTHTKGAPPGGDGPGEGVLSIYGEKSIDRKREKKGAKAKNKRDVVRHSGMAIVSYKKMNAPCS